MKAQGSEIVVNADVDFSDMLSTDKVNIENIDK